MVSVLVIRVYVTFSYSGRSLEVPGTGVCDILLLWQELRDGYTPPFESSKPAFLQNIDGRDCAAARLLLKQTAQTARAVYGGPNII